MRAHLQALKVMGIVMSFAAISVIGLGISDYRLRPLLLPPEAGYRRGYQQHAVDTINRGEVHIVEPALGNGEDGGGRRLFCVQTTTPVEADAYLIAVPTPFKRRSRPDGPYWKPRRNPLRRY